MREKIYLTNKQQMNNHFLFILIATLFFITCSEEKGLLISNTPSDLPDKDYELNLQSDSGENLNSVTISWNETDGTIELIDLTTSVAVATTGNSHTFDGMTPGEFRIISLIVRKDFTIYIDNIQIFTRTMFPVSTFEVEIDAIKVGDGVWDEGEDFDDLGNGTWDVGEELLNDGGNGTWDDGEEFTDLGNGTWDVGEELLNDDGNGQWDPGENFIDLGNEIWDTGEPFVDEKNGIWDPGENFIDLGNEIWDEGEPFDDKDTTSYHRNLTWSPTLESNENFSQYIIYRTDEPSQLIFPGSCNCEINRLSLLSDSTFIDSSSEVIGNSEEDAYYFTIQVVSVDGFTQNSFIANYKDFEQPKAIQLTGGVSTDKDEFIEIEWEPIPDSESEYFYQYEIWRSSNKALSDQARIVIISDPDQDIFMDRNVGYGATWYYSLAVVDISGEKKFSNFVQGWSNP